MDLKKEFNELSEKLKTQRGELEVQIHLASLDARDEWQKAEKKWGKFVDSLGVITDETKEASSELIHAAKAIGDELKETYCRIKDRLEK